MSFLKQSTTITLRLGPALDKTDGVTEETALTPTVEISKAGGAFAARNSATAIAHDSNGWYSVELNATDTNTVGLLEVKFDDAATHLPVWKPFTVLPAVVYDSLIAGSDNLDVSVIQWLGTAVTAGTAGVPNVDITRIANAAVSASTAQLGVNLVNIAGSAVSTSTAQLGVNTVSCTAGAINAAAVADGAIDRATFAADTGMQSIRSGTAQAGAAGTITLDASASAVDDFYNECFVFTTGGTGAGQCRQITDYVGSTKVATISPNWATNPDNTTTFAIVPFARLITAARVVDSGTLAAVSGLDVTLPGTASGVAQFYQYKTLKITGGTGSGQSRNIVTYTSGRVATIDTAWATAPNTSSTYEIHDTHSPYETSTALVDLVWDELRSGHVTSGTFGEKVNAQVVGLDSAAIISIRAVASGTADSGTTTTMVDAARTEADNDWWKGAWILFTSGTISGQCRQITGFTASSDTITFAPATTAAVSTQTYEILPAGAVDVRLWNGTAPSNLVSGRVDSSVGAMAADVVTAAAIQDNAIDAASIATGAITAAKFAAGAIDAAAIADNAIDAGALATGAITAAKFAAGAIDAAAIADNAIDAGAFATGAITAAKFAAGALDAAALAADAGTEIAAAVWDRAESSITTASSIGVKIKNVLPQRPIKNTALNNFEFTMIDSADHVSGKTGLTVTVQRSIDGGALAACVNGATEISNGIYKTSIDAADMNGDIITFRFSATGADDVTITVLTQPAAA